MFIAPLSPRAALLAAAFLTVFAAIAPTVRAANFIAGDLVVVRVGDGSAPLSSAATATFLDEYSPTGALVQSMALPTAVNGANRRLVLSGSATSEGALSRSVNARYVVMAGYDTVVGTASITGSSGATVNRVVARVAIDGSIDTTTALSSFATGGNPRSAATVDGTAFWLAGSSNGEHYASFGATTSTAIAGTPSNLRVTQIFGNQLYVSDSSGTAVRLGTIGSGVPTTAGQTISTLPGLPTSSGSPYGYFFCNLGGGAGADTLYVADDGSGVGIQKYALVGGTWTLKGAIGAASGVRGLTGLVNNGTVTLYATSSTSLWSYTDSAGYNAAPTGTLTTLALAGTNRNFRGVAFAPGVPGATTPAIVSTTPANSTASQSTSAAITITFNQPVTVADGWFSIVGASSGTHGATVTGSGSTYTLIVNSPFSEGETVTVTIAHDDVTESATNTLTMAADVTFSFTTFNSTPIAIHTVQGNGATSAFVGQAVAVEGVVTASFQAAGGIGGYYLEAPDAEWDSDPATSEGIYVFDNANAVSVGDRVRVGGTVAEFASTGVTDTELSSIIYFNKLSVGNALPTPVSVSLPFPSAVAGVAYAERYEGMRVTFPQTLTVADNFNLGHFGELLLSNGRLPTPTNIVAPGAPAQAQEAANQLNEIIVDDGLSTTYPDPTPFLDGSDPSIATRRGGSTTSGVTGVLANKFGEYVVEPTDSLTFADANPRQTAPASLGSLRVVFGNVENFMNGDGLGGGFPTSRGAVSYSDYQRQLAKVTAGILGLAPDIMGLSEVENDRVTNGAADSYGPTSAIAQLVASLNAAAPAGTSYAFINAAAVDIVTDQIHCAIIYRVETVQPVGNPAMLSDPSFNNQARNPLAQTLREKASGATFTFCVNHLRAKGGAAAGAGNTASGDGQGTNNALRVQEANALTSWLATDPTGSGDSRFLIVGDLNSYSKEDPITALENAGFINLNEQFEGVGGYSYSFGGEVGHLDHALASASLDAQVVSAGTWHVNSDEPVYYDYNTANKDAAQQAINVGTPYRYSDHDPVVVGLALTVPPTVLITPTAATATVGDSVTFTAVAAGAPTPTLQWRQNGNPIAGATDATLTLAFVTTANAGSYDVVAANVAGFATSNVAALTINKATPVVAWSRPADITYGTPLGAAQLNATASVAGSFIYSPAAGTVLSAGTDQPLSVIFTPADVADYNSVAGGTTISVNPAPATITLGDLAQVYDGSTKTVSVSVSPAGVPVQVTYSAAPVNAGSYDVSATVSDPNYVGSASASLVISSATPVITWAPPAPIVYGTALSSTQLSASANVSGTFAYTPDFGAVLPAGSQLLGTVFTPTDTHNYTNASASRTITVTQKTAAISVTDLTPAYDGTPKSVTVTTDPAGLSVNVTYNGSTTAPTAPGVYTVVVTVDDPNYIGTATATLHIGVTALVRHLPTLDGGVDGSVQVLSTEGVGLNGNAWISGDLLAPGLPAVRLNGHPSFGGVRDGSGAATPANYSVTLNGNAVLRYLVRRTDPIVLPVVSAPPAPAGTRDVSVNSAGQSVGSFATLRNLTLNGNVGAVSVPAGTYGNFTANGGSALVFGVAGSTTPAIYNLQSLALNGNADLRIVGPVIVNLANGVSFNGGVGAADHPEWLTLNVANGSVTLNGKVAFSGSIVAPNGTVTLNGNSTLTGSVSADRLVVNGSGVLKQP